MGFIQRRHLDARYERLSRHKANRRQLKIVFYKLAKVLDTRTCPAFDYCGRIPERGIRGMTNVFIINEIKYENVVIA